MRQLAFFLALSLYTLAVPALAYDGDMDIYHEFKEELSLVRDGYLACINMAMETATEEDAEGWFKLRDKGGAATWKDLEYELPKKESLPDIVVEELPYGFRIKGAHGSYKVDATVLVGTRDSDIFYDVQFAKGSNGPGKEIFGEVFRNDGSDSKRCAKGAVSCYDGKSTFGKKR